MRKLALFALLACGFGPEASPTYVVHEWGTFTSVAGTDGAMLDWRPLSGPDDLPKFVYRTGTGKGFLRPGGVKDALRGQVRMETPVLYFYADKNIQVSAKVAFPKGKITEWYPMACDVTRGINWGKFTVLSKAETPFPKEPAESHYYPARETDANPLQVWTRGAANEPEFQYEKFLFYRGVGTFDLPVRATLEGSTVTLRSLGAPTPGAILFENAGGKIGFRVLGDVSGTMTAERPVLSGSVDGIAQELEKALIATGLYPKEARAMVKTWRDSWFEEGVRLFYLVPRKATDEILPLTLEPKPTECVRTLVGRLELITPEREAGVLALVRKLGEGPAASREAAWTELRKLGRFAEPTLRRVQGNVTDSATKMQIQALLNRISAT